MTKEVQSLPTMINNQVGMADQGIPDSGLTLDVVTNSIYSRIQRSINPIYRTCQFNGGFMSFGDSKDSGNHPIEFVPPTFETNGSKRKKPDNSFDTHACPHCPRVFKRIGYLKMHLVTHMDSGKDFHCDFCGKAFAQKGHMMLHKKTHEPEQRLQTGLLKNNCLGSDAAPEIGTLGYYPLVTLDYDQCSSILALNSDISSLIDFDIQQLDENANELPQADTLESLDNVDVIRYDMDTLTNCQDLKIVWTQAPMVDTQQQLNDCLNTTVQEKLDLGSSLDDIHDLVMEGVLDMYQEQENCKLVGTMDCELPSFTIASNSSEPIPSGNFMFSL